ncbi:MAG: TIGR04255 family protein [Oscillospiraceae bacterium]|nr:TIGR04255 family protein [Oscillospiraceae bacterium]
MFSNEPRCRYQKNQLAEVICQLRFPEILSIGANAPVDFQEAIRADFPQFLRRQETPAPRITGTPGNLNLQNQPATLNYQFATADNVWRVNLTSKFISLTCTNYTCWEDFAAHLDKPLAAFIKIYKPAYFERVGLRYLNFFSRKSLELEGTPFSNLIAPCYLGPLADPEVQEPSASRCSVDAEMAIRGGCRVKLHAGPGLVKQNGREDKEVKFVFDQDLYMPGQLPVNLSAGALQTLHSQADSIFRGAISNTLHEAMEPHEI